MVDFPKIEVPDDWTRRANDLAARAQDMAGELTARGQELAEHWSGRVKAEARSFAHREEERIDALTALVTSPAAQLIGAAALGFVVGVAANSARKAAVQGAEAIAGDWLAVLKAEHKAVDTLFEALLKTGAQHKARRAALFAKIKWALMKHALQEETVVYPALKEAGGDAIAQHLYSDHAQIKIFISQIEQLPKDDPSWIERVREFQAWVANHVREEEDEIFPRFHDRMSPQQNGKLTLLLHREGLKLA